VNQTLQAATLAAVPPITPAEAADLVKAADALIVDARDGTQVAFSGTVKRGAVIHRDPTGCVGSHGWTRAEMQPALNGASISANKGVKLANGWLDKINNTPML
jgi:hypothetical protein